MSGLPRFNALAGMSDKHLENDAAFDVLCPNCAIVPFGNQPRDVKPKPEMFIVSALAQRHHRIEESATHLLGQGRPWIGYAQACAISQLFESDVDPVILFAEADGVVDELVEQLDQEFRRTFKANGLSIAPEVEPTPGPGCRVGVCRGRDRRDR